MSSCWSTQKIANASPAIARTHSAAAIRRNLVAFWLASGVGFHEDSGASSVVDSTRTTFFLERAMPRP